MKKIVILILALGLSSVTFAQDDAYIEDVKTCIESNGTYAYYENIVDQLFTMLEKRYASHNIPNTVWDELKTLKEESLDELSIIIVSVYSAHFSHQDVKNMNDLYATKAGQKMFESENELTKGDKKALAKFYRSETGQKITESQESMNDSMSKISDMWSRELYKSMVAKLNEKGFSL